VFNKLVKKRDIVLMYTTRGDCVIVLSSSFFLNSTLNLFTFTHQVVNYSIRVYSHMI